MTTSIEDLQDCAENASFHLHCAKNHMDWMLALARAIHLAHTHGQGEVGADLISLANYLGESGYPNTTFAIREFDELAEASSAPQNTDLANRGADSMASSRMTSAGCDDLPKAAASQREATQCN